LRINDLVDRVYLMNMDKRTDRLAASSHQLSKNNISFERFTAIDGTQVFNPTVMNPGQWGNYLSHLKIVEECAVNGVGSVAIFEDDVELCEDFEQKFASWYPLIPDNWDMIYLGYNKIAGESLPTNHPEIVKIRGAYAIHAIILNRSAIVQAYSDLSVNKAQADVYYAHLQSMMNAYSFSEQLCSQAPDWSDIDNKFVNHRWIFGWNSQ
jgi:GR25 family glycosyltransferase involved in LPS biosynthesis